MKDILSFLRGSELFYEGELIVDPAINGQSFIEMVRAIELPLEPKIAGGYLGIFARHALWPSRHFLGENSFGSEPENPLAGKTPVLICVCGDVGCWGLYAKIEVTEDEVIWSDFSHNHRPWSYEALGVFRFDKQQYLDALQSSPTIKSPAAERLERENRMRQG